MSHILQSQFHYFPRTPERARWGVEVLGCGFACIPSQSAYPPAGHPADHFFDFKKGRTLSSLQILCIVEGEGILRTASCKQQKIGSGDVFILFPGEWHTYRPDLATGWTEHWIEIDGIIPRQLLKDGVFHQDQCILRDAAASGILNIFQKIHLLLDERRCGSIPELSATTYQLLALCADLSTPRSNRSDAMDKIRHAERRLSEPTIHTAPNIVKLASELGWGYSYFRRIFKEQTGLSPWQYHLQSRLARVRRLMASSNDTMETIAEMSGFSSAFHLSNTFKKAYGTSPSAWRRRLKENIQSR